MSKKSIPKAHLPKQTKKLYCPKLENDEKNKFIIFSFRLLEWTDYFNLDATCPNWSHDLFEMLRDVSKITKIDLINNVYPTYRVHKHGNASSPSKLPEGVELKDCCQIRISKSKGGIHGIFVENVFYVIWLDPLHNMYPDDRYGGLRKIIPPKTCCKDRDEIILKLQDDKKNLEEEIQSLTEDLNFWENEYSKK